MRYGEPVIDPLLRQLQEQGVERLLVLPLYPQYSGATTGSVTDAVFASLSRWRWVPELRFMSACDGDPRCITAIAASIRSFGESPGEGYKLLISFHGMPKATVTAGDPYFCHCHKTARLIAEELGLADERQDNLFYSNSRFVQHLDVRGLGTVNALYVRLLPKETESLP